jgi:hypothetical protein
MAYFLNDAINHPARDAMLLRHALLDLKPAINASTSARVRATDFPQAKLDSTRLQLEGSVSVGESIGERVGEDARGRAGESAEMAQENKGQEVLKTVEPRDRYELLISRVVRLHWNRPHMTRVKDEYG